MSDIVAQTLTGCWFKCEAVDSFFYEGDQRVKPEFICPSIPIFVQTALLDDANKYIRNLCVCDCANLITERGRRHRRSRSLYSLKETCHLFARSCIQGIQENRFPLHILRLFRPARSNRGVRVAVVWVE